MAKIALTSAITAAANYDDVFVDSKQVKSMCYSQVVTTNHHSLFSISVAITVLYSCSFSFDQSDLGCMLQPFTVFERQ